MSLESCEHCGTYDAVLWSKDSGHTCLPCEEQRRAKLRAIEIDELYDKKKQADDVYKFFHE